MRPLPYWDRNPDVREFAIPLVENRSRQAVVEAIVQKFGPELAPSSEQQITKLRMGLAKGKWRLGVFEPNRNVRLSPRYGVRNFWDGHPSIRKLAIKMIEGENGAIRQAISARFGSQFQPSDQQLVVLREGVATGKYAVRDEPEAKSPQPSRVKSMLSMDPVDPPCLILGIKHLPKIQCLRRQVGFRVLRDQFSWNEGHGSSIGTTRRMLNPALAKCAKCANWLTTPEIKEIREIMKKEKRLEAAK